MKKIGKRVAALAVLMSVFASVYAGGLFDGSANTLRDDTSDLMNVLTWNNLNLDKKLFHTALRSANSINIDYATVLKNGQFHFSYDGNLWADDSTNSFQAMYGFENKAIAGFVKQYNFSENIPLMGSVSAKIWMPGAEFGINVNEKVGISVGAGVGFGSMDTMGDKVSFTIPTVSGLFSYKRTTTERKSDVILIGYTGAFTIVNYDYGYGSTKGGIYVNGITPTYKLEYKIAENCRYGLNVSLPVSITINESKDYDYKTTLTQFDFIISNGFIVDVKKDFLQIAAGLETRLPSISMYKVGDADSDVTKGNVTNTVYAGFALGVTKGVHIDFNANLQIFDGISFDELWKLDWTLSATARF